MMKPKKKQILFLLSALSMTALAACSEQPTSKVSNLAPGKYFIECGSAKTFCVQRANALCPRGYTELQEADEYRDGSGGFTPFTSAKSKEQKMNLTIQCR